MKPLFEGKYVNVLERDGWQYVERGKGKEAAAVLAETGDGEVIFTDQMEGIAERF